MALVPVVYRGEHVGTLDVGETSFREARRGPTYIGLFDKAFRYNENDRGNIAIEASDEDMVYFRSRLDYHPHYTLPPVGAVISGVVGAIADVEAARIEDVLRDTARAAGLDPDDVDMSEMRQHIRAIEALRAAPEDVIMPVPPAPALMRRGRNPMSVRRRLQLGASHG